MQIQVNTHDAVGGGDLAQRVEAMVAAQLDRFAPHLTRVEIHFGDVNADKGGAADKRCMIEARPNSHQPVSVTHHAATTALALDGALDKVRRALDRAMAPRTDHKGGASVRDNDLR
jgi:hypothetical protein